MVMGLSLKEIPFFMLMFLTALKNISADKMFMFSLSLGYSPYATWLKVIFPLIYKNMRISIFIVLAFSLSVVDIALILGTSASPTLPILIFNFIRDADISSQFIASSAAILQIGIVLFSYIMWVLLEKIAKIILTNFIIKGKRELIFQYLYYYLFQALSIMICAIVMGAILVLFLYAFSISWRFPDTIPSIFGLKNWYRESADLINAVKNSLVLALVSSFIGVAVIIFILEIEKKINSKKNQNSLKQSYIIHILSCSIYLPLLLPQISFLLGVQILLIYLNIAYVFINVLWMHLLFSIPYIYLILKDTYLNYDDKYTNIAKSFGKPPLLIFIKVKLSMLITIISTSFAVAFAVSLGQYLPTILASAGSYNTLTTEAVTLSSGGQ